MPELDLNIEGNAEKVRQQPQKIRVLNLSIVLNDEDNVAEIISTAAGLGSEVRSVSVNQQYDYGANDPFGY